ncbi:hypothetical protein OHS33_01870 [Streptomyces sp. NBC_00536]|uniref:hypothetical protein n=1 Tax=Streptomyces sp. NBC_00536 TaxID=2975769 RepID=UPI002E7FC103|nr:hypothetical protein [Streptomyces sp. NBC_00536]WUC77207.1 hypothetical protein OHS33_01870 [Streptomyces sp. NBC_00536]
MLPPGSIGWALLAGIFVLAAVVVRATGGPRPDPGGDPRGPGAVPSTPATTEVTT